MQRRFFKALPPLKYQKRLQKATALIPIFRRVNLFLASCSSAELASASVQCKVHHDKLYLQPVKKSSHLHVYIRRVLKHILTISPTESR